MWDVAEEYWLYRQMTKDDDKQDEGQDFWDDDLDNEFEDEWDSEPEEDFDFETDSYVPPVAAPPAEEKREEPKKRVKSVKAKKEEQPTEPATAAPVNASWKCWLVGTALVILVAAVLLSVHMKHAREQEALAASQSVSYSVNESEMEEYRSSVRESVLAEEATRTEPETTAQQTTRRVYGNYTKEDFYGVDDYVDAADFADEMQDEFDDWEDAYDYYEENAE